MLRATSGSTPIKGNGKMPYDEQKERFEAETASNLNSSDTLLRSYFLYGRFPPSRSHFNAASFVVFRPTW